MLGHNALFWAALLSTACRPAAVSSASAWHSLGDRYTAWQARRPLTIAAWHNRVPSDHMADCIARMRAAGVNMLHGGGLLDGRHFFRGAHDAGLPWSGVGMSGKIARYFADGRWREQCAEYREALDRTLALPGAAYVMVMDEPDVLGRPEAEQATIYEELILTGSGAAVYCGA